MAKLATALVVLAISGASLAAKLPASFPTCHVNDVEFNTCLAGAIEKSIHVLKDGEKTLGINSIDPMLVEEMTLDLGNGPFAIVLNAKNLTVKGLSKTVIRSAELDAKKHVLTVNAFTPHLRLDMQYKASGKILVVAVAGDGPAFFDLENVNTTGVVTAQPMDKKGKTYWNMQDFKVDIVPTKMSCHFHELLKGNAQVSEQVNGFLNNDWKLFYQQIKKPAEEAFGEIFKQMAGRVFNRVPISDVYLDI